MVDPTSLSTGFAGPYTVTSPSGNKIQSGSESLELAWANAGLLWVSLFCGTQGEIESIVPAHQELWQLVGKPVLAEIGRRLSLALGPFADLSQAQRAQDQARSRFPQAEVISPPFSLLFRRPGNSDLGWGGEGEEPALLLSPSGDDCTFSLNGRSYRGNLELFWRGAELRIINILALEKYLYGVVPAEMPHDWHSEALKAQALASRSYAMKKVQENKSAVEGYDLNATIYDQVYRGYEVEKPESNAAVDATKGQVLMCEGKIITASFHSCSGGHTENNENVWQGSAVPYLRGVLSPGEEGSKYYSWTQTVTASEFLRRVEEKKGIKLGNFKQLNILEKGVSGRVKVLEVVGSTGTATLTGEELRKAADLRSSLVSLDYSPGGVSASLALIASSGIHQVLANTLNILSTQGNSPASLPLAILSSTGLITLDETYSLSLSSDVITFIGQGWGHGVGMPQWGAKARAEEGLAYDKILTYYYQGVQIASQY